MSIFSEEEKRLLKDLWSFSWRAGLSVKIFSLLVLVILYFIYPQDYWEILKGLFFVLIVPKLILSYISLKRAEKVTGRSFINDFKEILKK